MVRKYIVYIPGMEKHAQIIAAESSWEARKVVAKATPSKPSPHDFVAIRVVQS